MDPFGPTLRRTRRREHPAWRALLAITISVILNLLLVTQLDASWLGVGKLAERRAVSIAPLTAADWEANRAVGATPAEPKAATRSAPRSPEPRPPVQHQGQVVELGHQPAATRTPPADTRYVSEHDTVVEKETRARTPGLPGQQAAPTPSEPATALSTGKSGEQGTSELAKPGAPGPKGQKVSPDTRVATAERAEAEPQGAGETAPRRADAPAPHGAGEGGEQRQGDPRLAIPAQTMARLTGSGSPDHLPGVEEGEGTFLNSREWKYASYFNRIKEAVARTWYQKVDHESTRRDPTNSVYLFKERFTLIEYVLDDKGAIKDLSVAKSSSVDFLDRVAMESIREAQPFPNPPRGLIDANGEVHWTFGFTITPDRGGAVRVYRSPMP